MNLKLKIALISNPKRMKAYEIAREVGISDSMLSSFIYHQVKAYPQTAKQLAELLGCKVSELFDESEIREAYEPPLLIFDDK